MAPDDASGRPEDDPEDGPVRPFPGIPFLHAIPGCTPLFCPIVLLPAACPAGSSLNTFRMRCHRETDTSNVSN